MKPKNQIGAISHDSPSHSNTPIIAIVSAVAAAAVPTAATVTGALAPLASATDRDRPSRGGPSRLQALHHGRGQQPRAPRAGRRRLLLLGGDVLFQPSLQADICFCEGGAALRSVGDGGAHSGTRTRTYSWRASYVRIQILGWKSARLPVNNVPLFRLPAMKRWPIF